jgi:hypothetical protein
LSASPTTELRLRKSPRKLLKRDGDIRIISTSAITQPKENTSIAGVRGGWVEDAVGDGREESGDIPPCGDSPSPPSFADEAAGEDAEAVAVAGAGEAANLSGAR